MDEKKGKGKKGLENYYIMAQNQVNQVVYVDNYCIYLTSFLVA